MGRKLIKLIGGGYHFVKRGREYHGCGEEYNMEKKEKKKHDHLPYNIKAAGKNMKWGKGGRPGISMRKITVDNRNIVLF